MPNYEATVTAAHADELIVTVSKTEFGKPAELEVLFTFDSVDHLRTRDLDTRIHAKGYVVVGEWEIGTALNVMKMTVDVLPRS